LNGEEVYFFLFLSVKDQVVMAGWVATDRAGGDGIASEFVLKIAAFWM